MDTFLEKPISSQKKGGVLSSRENIENFSEKRARHRDDSLSRDGTRNSLEKRVRLQGEDSVSSKRSVNGSLERRVPLEDCEDSLLKGGDFCILA